MKTRKKKTWYVKHPVYNVLDGMKQRCYNSNHPQYKDYGGRGIGVYEEWRNSFKVFCFWALLHGWQKGLLIDRIDNNKNYSPTNCRFVTKAKSNLNRQLLQENNHSGYRRVSFEKRTQRYKARVGVKKQEIWLGRYETALVAAVVRDKFVRKLGDGRPLNFPRNQILAEEK